MSSTQRAAYSKPDEVEKRAVFAALKQVAGAVERMFRPHCEVVIHHFSDLQHSIIHLEGDLSHRSIGGAATDLLLQRIGAGETAEDLYNYKTELSNGRIMRSSTIFLREASGMAYGAFCINYDLSVLVGVQKVLSELTRLDASENVSETLSDDINQTIRTIILETIGELGIHGSILNRTDKVSMIAKLDEKGVFQVKKAVPILAEQFGWSRATIYNYLRESRNWKARNDGRVRQENVSVS